AEVMSCNAAMTLSEKVFMRGG
ncbi:MAG: hypothetical protein RJB17_1352, partial [Pseudomonadota bacterium]